MTQQKSIQAEAVVISVARQGVFDRLRRLWGYELFCVGNTQETPSGVPSGAGVPISLAGSAGVGLQRMLNREKRFLVSLSEKNILDGQAYALPPAITTVFVDEQVFMKPGVEAKVEQLRSDGFPIAVPVFTGNQGCENLYKMADIMGVSVKDRPRHELGKIVAEVREYGAAPMANRVSDADCFEICQELGFDLFQGAFSKIPEIVPMRKVSSNQMVRFNLLKVLESEERDIQALVEQIQTDAAISFRMLTYLNSASFGLTHKVKSIPHAITMLGWNKVHNWLRVILLSDINDGDENSELLLIAAQRAKFLELVAKRYSFWGFEPESMHLLGLFSLLDAMIGVPMKEIVSYLPLDSGLKAGLCREPDSEYLLLINLVQDLEEARWSEAEATISQLNLDNAGTKAAFQEAVDWAGELISMMEE